MKISIFSDKFSGTLSATQVIEIINKVFNENLIQASYFPVTDGGEDSSIIFKEHGFKAYKNLIAKDLAGNKRNIELITLNREIFFESSLLIGINNTDIDTMKLNTSCLAEIIKIAESANTKVLLMQIRIPPNYGSRYQKAFESIYSNIASETSATLIPFMLEEVALNEELMLPDGIHPKASAQPLIADYVYRQLKPLLNH